MATRADALAIRALQRLGAVDPTMPEAAHFRCKELARMCHCSSRQLRRRIRRQFNTTPKKWLNAARLEAAADLLDRGVSAKQTALKLGFKQLSHFSKWFRLSFRVAPSQYAHKEPR